VSNHFEEDILLIEKYRYNKVFSAVYYDGEKKYHYVKRFTFDPVENLQVLSAIMRNRGLYGLTEVEYPRLEVKFGGKEQGTGQ
jgi:topoisomerase IV subunit A